MTIGELIDMLEQHDPTAEVLILSQEHYPYEHRVMAVVPRGAVVEGMAEDESIEGEGKPSRTDVFLVEGPVLRYGRADVGIFDLAL